MFKAKLELGAGAHSERLDGAGFERPKSRPCNVELTQGGEWQREDDPVIDLVENLGIAGQRQPHLSIWHPGNGGQGRPRLNRVAELFAQKARNLVVAAADMIELVGDFVVEVEFRFGGSSSRTPTPARGR